MVVIDALALPGVTPELNLGRGAELPAEGGNGGGAASDKMPPVPGVCSTVLRHAVSRACAILALKIS